MVVKHFISSDPVNNPLDTQFNNWKNTLPTLFIAFMQYGFLAKADGTAEYSLMAAGYDTTASVPQATGG